MEPSVRLSHRFSLMSHLEHFQPLTQGEKDELKYGSGAPGNGRARGLWGPHASPRPRSSLVLWMCPYLVLLLQISLLVLLPILSPTRSPSTWPLCPCSEGCALRWKGQASPGRDSSRVVQLLEVEGMLRHLPYFPIPGLHLLLAGG